MSTLAEVCARKARIDEKTAPEDVARVAIDVIVTFVERTWRANDRHDATPSEELIVEAFQLVSDVDVDQNGWHPCEACGYAVHECDGAHECDEESGACLCSTCRDAAAEDEEATS